MTAQRTLLLAIALCGACGVGEPLVDRFPPPPMGGVQPVRCNMPADCMVPLELKLSQPVAKDLVWQTCPQTCGGGTAGTAGGAIGADVDRPTLECIEVEPLQSLANDQICVTARFAMTAAAPPLSAVGNVGADGVVWQDANIVIEADDAVEVVVSSAQIRNARIDLRGPITLRFQDATTIEDVGISSDSRDAVVAFERVAPSGLTVGDPVHAFKGHVDARHSSFRASSFVLTSFELDSVMVDGAYLASEDLIANDGALHDVTLELGNATFAPTSLKAVDILSCETLSFFGSSLRNVLIPRCDSGEPTRLYATDFISGRLDGLVSGDGGKLEGVLLGQRSPSHYELWNVRVSSAAFCGQVQDVKVGENTIQCSTCSDGALAALEAACTLPLGGIERDEVDDEGPANFCEPLDMLEPCPPPVPMRTRPIGEL